jgi:hypothetical protein
VGRGQRDGPQSGKIVNIDGMAWFGQEKGSREERFRREMWGQSEAYWVRVGVVVLAHQLGSRILGRPRDPNIS